MELSVDGQLVHYEETGNGASVALILQGWGTNCELYRPIARMLSSRYRVISPDFPGFGSSPEPEEAWPVSRYADFTEAFLRVLGVRRVTIVAHSYGSRVALCMAARPSGKITIDRMVLTGAAGILPERTRAQERKTRRYKFLRDLFAKPWVYDFFPDLIDDWKSRQGSDDYRAATPLMRRALVMAVNEDLSPLLPKIDREVLLIWGAQDDATPLSDGRKMEAQLPKASLCVIEEAGHYAFLEKPEVFAEVLGSFMRG